MNVAHSEIVKESDHDMNIKRKKSFTWCDVHKDTEFNSKGKSFKPISKFYCHNFHGYGHYAIDCK